MLFYFLGLLVLISTVVFFYKEDPNKSKTDKDLSCIQKKILLDESLFIEEHNANQSKIRKGEYLSPTLNYSIKSFKRIS